MNPHLQSANVAVGKTGGVSQCKAANELQEVL